MKAFVRRRISTSHGEIVMEDNEREGTPLLLLHGNSSSREVFTRQLNSPLATAHRLIALDLPGHGESSDAIDPLRTYSLSGLAECAFELLGRIGVRDVILLGWSLGGHIAIEMLSRSQSIKGMILIGAPPIRRGAMSDGFLSSPAQGLPGRRDLTDAEIDVFARMMFGDPVEPFLRRAIRRADGRFREQLFAAALAGDGADQRLAVEAARAPMAVVNSEDDPLIRLSYLESVAYGNLWNGRCHRLPEAGHAIFWRAADAFNSLAARFLEQLEAS